MERIMKKKPIRNRILHAARTPLFGMRVEKNKKKEAKKSGDYYGKKK